MAYSALACFVVTIVGIASSWLLALLRFIGRGVVLHVLQWDDFLGLLAVIMYTAAAAFYLDALNYRGLHQHPDLPAAVVASRGIRGYMLSSLLLFIGSGTIKISFALTLLRIVRRRLHIYTLYTAIVTTVLTTTITFFLILFQCRPISFVWNRVLDHSAGTCDRNLAVKVPYAHGTLVLLLDIVLGIVLPIDLLVDLRMNIRVKVLTACLLSLGSLASIATIIRMSYQHQLRGVERADFINVPLLWGLIELSSSIVCVFAGTLKPMLVACKVLTDSTIGTRNFSGNELEDRTVGRRIRASQSYTQTPTTISTLKRSHVKGERGSSTEIITLEEDSTLGIWRSDEYSATSQSLGRTDQRTV